MVGDGPRGAAVRWKRGECCAERLVRSRRQNGWH